MANLRLWDGKTEVYLKGYPFFLECAGEVEYDPKLLYENAYMTIGAMARNGQYYILHQDGGFYKIILKETV